MAIIENSKLPPPDQHQLEIEAQKLNLSLSAYIQYLEERQSQSKDVNRLDRHIHSVFGKHGELMRRLAK